MSGNSDLYLVIGGSGFVGRRLALLLLNQGRRVRVFDRTPIGDSRVDMMVGDIRRAEEVQRACDGATVVFQCASLVDWRPGSDQALYDVNVAGNRNVLAACAARDHVRLVYTSSIDVVFEGRPIRDGDETLPYAARHLDMYGRTKMLAEQETLAAAGKGLAACALRLAGVYGPGDNHRLPTLIAQARRGWMVRLGDGSARFNHVYVDNAAYAHLLAAERLTSGTRGASYFIIDHPPRNFFEFTGSLLADLGFRTPPRAIPYRLAYMLATALEYWARATRGRAGVTPLTRYAVASTCVDFYFRGDKARRELGYAPPVSEAEARAQTLAWLRASY